jgi:nucleoside 2-deoxyribosyltransferase
MKVYLAAALFSQAERLYNQALAQAIARHLPDCEVLLPQDFPVDADGALDGVHSCCMDGLEQADAVVALLEGPDVDCGVAWEMGYAHARGLPVLGVRTDFRDGQEAGVNLMLARGCNRIVHLPNPTNNDMDAVARDVADCLSQVCATTERK